MMLTMCACAQTNAAKDKVNDSILDIDTQEKEANGKLKAELSFEGELIDVIAYRNSDFGKDITTFTLKDSGLKAEGNKIALNLGDADSKYYRQHRTTRG